MESKNNKRRQFLRNSTLAALSLGLFPKITKAEKPSDVLDESGGCVLTTPDFYGEGPFYTDNPPILSTPSLAAADEPGTKLTLSGRVFNLDCTQWVPNAELDLWHANDSGVYDNEGYNLRGKVYTNEQGFYIFETIKPGKYQLRPSHIHVKISADGIPTLTTQIYFEGDSDIPLDPAASLTSGAFDATSRIVPLTTLPDGSLEGTWDVTLNLLSVSINDIHLNKGIIYSAGPNPFQDELVIKYGVFKSSKVSLQVYDIQGRLMADLEETTLGPEKYEAIWQPDSKIPTGHYFVTLKINDLQVHYMKVMKI